MLSSAPIRTAVIIGAGGSSFARIPTVMSFFERIDWPPSNGFHAACEELARRISIFEGTHESLAWPKFDAEKLFGWLEILEKTMHLQDPRMGILIPNPNIPIPVAGVIAHIRQQIVKIYGSRIDPEFLSTAPHRTLMEALDKLHPPSAPLYVFTTNYDPVLEQVFKEWSARPFPSGRKLRACDGFSSDHPRRWQPQLFSVGPEDGERLIHLVKLHGSATWKLDTTGRSRPDGVCPRLTTACCISAIRAFRRQSPSSPSTRS